MQLVRGKKESEDPALTGEGKNGKGIRLKNKPDDLFFNRQFCAEAPNCCDRREEITCVISPRGLSTMLRQGGKNAYRQ